MDQETWIADIVTSGEEIRSKKAPEHLLEGILKSTRNPQPAIIPLKQLKIALAAASILAVLNIGILLSARGEKKIADSVANIESYDLSIY